MKKLLLSFVITQSITLVAEEFDAKAMHELIKYMMNKYAHECAQELNRITVHTIDKKYGPNRLIPTIFAAIPQPYVKLLTQSADSEKKALLDHIVQNLTQHMRPFEWRVPLFPGSRDMELYSIIPVVYADTNLIKIAFLYHKKYRQSKL